MTGIKDMTPFTSVQFLGVWGAAVHTLCSVTSTWAPANKAGVVFHLKYRICHCIHSYSPFRPAGRRFETLTNQWTASELTKTVCTQGPGPLLRPSIQLDSKTTTTTTTNNHFYSRHFIVYCDFREMILHCENANAHKPDMQRVMTSLLSLYDKHECNGVVV